jgi:hypothetical protein
LIQFCRFIGRGLLGCFFKCRLLAAGYQGFGVVNTSLGQCLLVEEAIFTKGQDAAVAFALDPRSLLDQFLDARLARHISAVEAGPLIQRISRAPCSHLGDAEDLANLGQLGLLFVFLLAILLRLLVHLAACLRLALFLADVALCLRLGFLQAVVQRISALSTLATGGRDCPHFPAVFYGGAIGLEAFGEALWLGGLRRRSGLLRLGRQPHSLPGLGYRHFLGWGAYDANGSPAVVVQHEHLERLVRTLLARYDVGGDASFLVAERLGGLLGAFLDGGLVGCGRLCCIGWGRSCSLHFCILRRGDLGARLVSLGLWGSAVHGFL